jgi:hypothetical protein
MDYEASAKGCVTIDRRVEKKKHSFDDFLYMLMGDATPANILVMIFTVCFFAATPLAMLMLFGTYSGGMGWLITLGAITAMGLVAIYLMKRGIKRQATLADEPEAKMSYPGELTGLTETFERAADGYVYSQQMIRERLCDITIDKIGLARDMDQDEIISRLEKGDASFVDDRFLAQFLKANRRGAQDLDEARMHGKGKSRERGAKFMLEIDEILKHMEEII